MPRLTDCHRDSMKSAARSFLLENIPLLSCILAWALIGFIMVFNPMNCHFPERSLYAWIYSFIFFEFLLFFDLAIRCTVAVVARYCARERTPYEGLHPWCPPELEYLSDGNAMRFLGIRFLAMEVFWRTLTGDVQDLKVEEGTDEEKEGFYEKDGV